MNRFFSRSPISSKTEIEPKDSQQLFDRKFQQCITSEQDFVRNVGFFLEKLKSNDQNFYRKSVDRIKIQIKSSKSCPTEKFLSLLLLKTLLECEETKEIALYSSGKILRRLRIIAEKTLVSKSFSPFFFKKKQGDSQKKTENKAFIQLLLECLKFWGFKYKPHLLEKGLNSFRKTYQELIKKGVIFPETYRFFWKDGVFQSKETFGNTQGFIEKKGTYFEKSEEIHEKKESFEEKKEELTRKSEEKKAKLNEKKEFTRKSEEKPEIKEDYIEKKNFIVEKPTIDENFLYEKSVNNNGNFLGEKPLIFIKKSNQNQENSFKNPRILIKSRSLNDLLAFVGDLTEKTPVKKESFLEKIPMKSLNIEDFLSKISSNQDSSPVQTPEETLESPKDCFSIQQLAEKQLKKLENSEVTFSKKIEGILTKNQKKSPFEENMNIVISTASIEERLQENQVQFSKKEEKLKNKETFLSEKEKNKASFNEIEAFILEDNEENNEKVLYKEEKPHYKEEIFHFKDVKPLLNEEKVAFSEEKSLFLSEIVFLKNELSQKHKEMTFSQEKTMILSQELVNLRQEYEKLTHFSLLLQSKLDQSLLKNADLILDNEELRRENEKMFEFKRENQALSQKCEEIDTFQRGFDKMQKLYEDLQFQYESLFNDKMVLEIQRKKLKTENQELLKEIEVFKMKDEKNTEEKRSFRQKKPYFEDNYNEEIRITEKEGIFSEKKGRKTFSLEKKAIFSEKKVDFLERKTSFSHEKALEKLLKPMDFSIESPYMLNFERKLSISEGEEPNFYINKSFDSRSKCCVLKSNKSLSFFEKTIKDPFIFKYIEGKSVDNDLLRLSELIKTDKFLKNEENFKKLCLKSEGKLIETEYLLINFIYMQTNNKEILLELSFQNITELEITSFQSKVLNPRSKTLLFLLKIL